MQHFTADQIVISKLSVKHKDSLWKTDPAKAVLTEWTVIM